MISNDFSARQHPERKGRIGATLGRCFERAGGFGRTLPSPTGLLLYGSNSIKWGRWRRPSMAGLGHFDQFPPISPRRLMGWTGCFPNRLAFEG